MVNAPGGDASITFELPFAPGELARLAAGLRLRLRFEEDTITRSGVTELGVWAAADQSRVGLYLPAIYR